MPSVKDNLVAKLKTKAQINTQEPIFASVADLVDEALMEHAPEYALNYDELETSEYELVLLLAWERVCLSRASYAAPQPSLITPGHQAFGSDRDTPFKKNMALAKALRERYDDLVGRLEAEDEDDESSSAGDITVGEFYRKDELIDARVPFKTSPSMKPPTLVVRELNAEAGTVVLGWEKISSNIFGELIIFQSTEAGIYQEWNADGNGGVPFVSAAATRVFSTTDNVKRGVKITDLDEDSYYYVMACRDASGNYSFSNEVTVATVAYIPDPSTLTVNLVFVNTTGRNIYAYVPSMHRDYRLTSSNLTLPVAPTETGVRIADYSGSYVLPLYDQSADTFTGGYTYTFSATLNGNGDPIVTVTSAAT